MKTRGLFLSALMMGAVMAGCSNEEVLNDDFQKPDGNEYYMAVNIFTSGVNSRAADDFVAATDVEVEVKNAVFYFLDEKGNSCAEPYMHSQALSLSASNHHEDSDDREGTPIIVMKNPTTNPSSIVTLLNVPEGFAYNSYKNLAALQAISGDYRNYANGFVMSNSVYVDGEEVVIGAPVTENHIYKTREELEVGMVNNSAVAVPIHVERVLAKVVVEDYVGENISDNEVNLNGEGNTAINVTINGWWLNDAKDKSYMVKSLEPESYIGTWWNDVANLRSYWAESYGAAGFLGGSWSSNVDDVIYCHENTSTNPTQLVVAATLSVGNDEATTLVRWRNTYYTEDGFKDAFLNNFLSAHKYYYQEGEGEYVTITKDMLSFAYNTNDTKVTTHDYEAIVTLNTTEQLYTISGTTATPVNASEVEEKLEGYATVKLWNGGKTYYYLPIAHLAESGANAVVRNHVYQMNLNSVAGLGTPVPNPDKVIIPEKVEDDELSYIAASVYVLKWKLVENNVNLK